MIDIVICDHQRESVTIVKADENVIRDEYDNSVETYIVEYLDFKLSQISWMAGSAISVEIFGGIPTAGLSVTPESYWDSQD